MRIAFGYRFKTDNVGDLVSSPMHYFDFGKNVVRFDLKMDLPPPADMYIYGGGGVVSWMKSVRRKIRHNYRGHKAKHVAWGVGSINKGVKTSSLAPGKYRLYGTRDLDTRTREVALIPCASCMSSIFDPEKDTQPEHEVVAYFNHRPADMKRTQPNGKGLPVPELGKPLPTMHNRSTLEESVRFLRSGSAIVTNSYHGAYWGLLLGRRVVIVNPDSSKFFNLPVEVEAVPEAGWEGAMRRATPTRDLLSYCRKLNQDFYARVRTLIHESNIRTR